MGLLPIQSFHLRQSFDQDYCFKKSTKYTGKTFKFGQHFLYDFSIFHVMDTMFTSLTWLSRSISLSTTILFTLVKQEQTSRILMVNLVKLATVPWKSLRNERVFIEPRILVQTMPSYQLTRVTAHLLLWKWALLPGHWVWGGHPQGLLLQGPHQGLHLLSLVGTRRRVLSRNICQFKKVFSKIK